MKKIIVLAALVAANLWAYAQMTPEAIMGSCPQMPDWHDVADYFIKQNYGTALGFESSASNVAVDNYFKMLRDAENSSRIMVAKMPAPNDNEAKKRGQQINKQRNDRMAAGMKMKQFYESLTPEQQKTLMNCKNEQESMAAIKKMGKWEEFSALMSGTNTSGSDSPLTKEEQEWLSKDLSAENANAARKIDDAIEALNKVRQRYQETWPAVEEKASAIAGKIVNAEEAAVGKGSGSVKSLRAQLRDLLEDYYSGIIPDYLKAHQAHMDAVRSRMSVAKMNDKKDTFTRRINGLGPASSIERDDYSTAMWYLKTAYDILLGESYEFPEE